MTITHYILFYKYKPQKYVFIAHALLAFTVFLIMILTMLPVARSNDNVRTVLNVHVPTRSTIIALECVALKPVGLFLNI